VLDLNALERYVDRDFNPANADDNMRYFNVYEIRTLIKIAKAGIYEHPSLHLPTFHPGCELCLALKAGSK
jgi:hypothetical protein